MKTLLLLTQVQIGGIILALFFVLGIVLIIAIKNNKIKFGSKKIKLDKVDGESFLELKLPYMTKKEVVFYETFKKILPKDYIVLPKVGIANLVNPRGSLALYKQINSAFVDMCIFLKSNMQPVAIIDLIDRSTGGDSTLNQQDSVVTKSLNGVKLPVIVYEIKSEYDLALLLEKFLDVLDPIYLTQLRKIK